MPVGMLAKAALLGLLPALAVAQETIVTVATITVVLSSTVVGGQTTATTSSPASATGSSTTAITGSVTTQVIPGGNGPTNASSASTALSSATGITGTPITPSSNGGLLLGTGLAPISTSFSPTPVSTAIPSASATGAVVPGQSIYPPTQQWCNGGSNDTFCPGALLQDVQLAAIFPDSKTFVDKPTNGTLDQVYAAFNALGSNITTGQILTFVEQNFQGEGLELSQAALQGFNATPAILSNISDPIIKNWINIVNTYWTLLVRDTNDTAVCQPGTCESSLIPLNYTTVVPGGRYRETYYWDSFWIVEGLLKSQLYTYAWDVLQNFMDFIENYGFIPNGGRKYYLNRSQPPMFIQMLDAYIQATGNVTILNRALPLAEKEMQWWANNRFINITSPFTNQTYTVARYDASINTAPRPEGYVEDYETAFGASPALNESQRGDLYADLATGAESGWDYSARWCRQPVINVSDNYPALRTLNTRAIIPVDLNALLAGDHNILGAMYEQHANSLNTSNTTSFALAQYHRAIAANLSRAILDIHWDPTKAWFYDFNISSNARDSLYTPAGTFALWQNITPSELINNNTVALQMTSGMRYLLGKYTGIPSVATLLYTGLNWDFPNSWPPHAYSSIKALELINRVIPGASTLFNLTIPYDQVVAGQLGLNESALQPQNQSTASNSSLVSLNTGQPWPIQLAIEYANRYETSAFCSWLSTGGSIPGFLEQLPLSDLNRTGTYASDQTGVMFEKFSVIDADAAGGGGEYTVQIGFGWTNGVALWIAGEYGRYLPQPRCPLIPIIEETASGNYSVYANGTTVPYNAQLFKAYRIPPGK